MSQQTIYVPKCNAKLRPDCQWWELKVGFHASTLIEFIKANTTESGWFNIAINERKQPTDKGVTHSVKLDVRKPDESRQAKPDQVEPEQSNDNGPVPF